MPTQLPDDARRRLEEGQLDLRRRCWYNVQRLHKWSGRLESNGPSGEDADHYKTMGPRSLILGPIVWDGPTDKRKLEWDEITAALRANVRHLLGFYARELVTLVVGEWWSLGMTGAEFEARITAVLQSVLVDLKGVAKDADADLGLGLDIAEFVADTNIELQSWCKDYVERYGSVVGLYGTAEAGAPPLPHEIPQSQLRESPSATEKDASGQASALADQTGAEAGGRAFVLGTAGIASGKPPAGTFASNPKIQKLVEEQPKLSGLVSQVSQVEQARAEAEAAFRERELAEQWGTWSGVHPWEDKLDLETTDCPWWIAGAEYVFRIVFAWRTHSPSTSDRTAAGVPKQVELTATWVYWNRVFVHDGVNSKKPKIDDLFGDMNAKRFANFAFLFCLRRFAEEDLEEWRQKAASLKGVEREIASPVAEGVPKETAPVADQGAMRVTSIDGSVRWINPEGVDAEKSIWTPEDEKRISACVFDGRAAVRSELEKIFSGKEWPPLTDLIEPFRRYAITVFDVYASAYQQVARTSAAYQEALDELLLPMVLRDLFGREWDRAPGDSVVRTLWQNGPDGKTEGREVETVAGNDPDPTCVFYELLSHAIEHRHRFFDPLPAREPGELPGIGLTNLGLWQYIGLKERHNIAMAIKPYVVDRVAHWRFIYVPTPADSDSTGGPTKNEAIRQPAPEENTVTAQPSMAPRVSAATAPEMDSPTRIKFETGLALAEVTLAQDLKEHGPNLAIARKYVISATLTLARCILTPDCKQPYEAIQRAYDFAEWFAAETMKKAWIWLCVFSEMNASGKLKKYDYDGKPADSATQGMSDSELREWHGCLHSVAHEALDEFLPEFWKERHKYFSEIGDRDATVLPAVTTGDMKVGEPDRDRTGVASGIPDLIPPRRTPDLAASRERIALVDTLARELAILKQDLRGYCTTEGLKQKHPKFTVWTLIEDSQIKALVDGEAFTPKAYAENLTLAKFGLTSRETLKKDRQKLRNAKVADQK